MKRLVAIVLVVALATTPAFAGCNRNRRDDAVRSLTEQLVDGGLERDIAECVVERFFAERSNDEIDAFFDRPELTEGEQAEFARLGAECTTANSIDA
jgi:hypothetical protein